MSWEMIGAYSFLNLRIMKPGQVLRKDHETLRQAYEYVNMQKWHTKLSICYLMFHDINYIKLFSFLFFLFFYTEVQTSHLRRSNKKKIT